MVSEAGCAEYKLNSSILSSHFVNNVFTMMRTLNSHQRIEQLDDVLTHFSRLFHYCQGSTAAVKAEEELAFVAHYLELQRYRFGRRISYRIVPAETDENRSVIRFSVFMVVADIVENIFEPSTTEGFIEIELVDNITVLCKCGSARLKSTVGIISRDSG